MTTSTAESVLDMVLRESEENRGQRLEDTIFWNVEGYAEMGALFSELYESLESVPGVATDVRLFLADLVRTYVDHHGARPEF